MNRGSYLNVLNGSVAHICGSMSRSCFQTVRGLVFRLFSVQSDWNGQKEGTLACVKGNTSGSSFNRRAQVVLCRLHRREEQSDAKCYPTMKGNAFSPLSTPYALSLSISPLSLYLLCPFLPLSLYI